MKLNEAILKVQGQVKALSKDKTNPFFKSQYFDINQIIAEIMPLLVENGITVTQPLTNLSGKPALATVLSKDEECLEYIIPLPETIKPQEMGSAITYYRRYALQSYFLLQAEDDDANGTKGEFIQKKGNNDEF